MERSYPQDFLLIAKEFLENEEYMKLDNFNHHGNTILDHTMKVSFLAWKTGGFFNLDRASLVRGALLHDFFLYDWKKKRPGARKFYEIHKMHGFTHPAEALRNAESHYRLNEIEKNIIERHMFPLTLIPPRYKESWIVTLCDKWISLTEIPLYLKHLLHNKKRSSSS